MIRIFYKYELYEVKKLALHRTENHLSKTPLPQLRITLENYLSNDSHIRRLTETLGDINTEITTDELKTILSAIHGLTLHYADKVLKSERISPIRNSEGINKLLSPKRFHELIDGNIELLKKYDYFKVFSNTEQALRDQCLLMHSLNAITTDSADHDKIVSFLLSEFPEIYAKRMHYLTFPEWRCVCFNKDYSNPALWGYYADGHHGICMIFKEPKDNKFKLRSKDVLDDFQINPVIENITYDQPVIRIDYFSTLGKLFVDERNHWFTDNGETSNKIHEITDDIGLWNRNYESVKRQRYLTKFKSWESEKESRIVIDNEWKSFNASSKYLFDFNDLEGIIFGVKTSLSDKAQIIKIIQEKCAEHNRSEFNFFQAKIDKSAGTIVAEKIDLIHLLKIK